MTIWAILPAAGIGRRMGSSTPKQYLPLTIAVPAAEPGAAEKAVILYSIERLLSVERIDKLIVVLHPKDRYWETVDLGQDARLSTCAGGDERYKSVLNGLKYIAAEARPDDWVLVHDAVRPCVRPADVEKLISALDQHCVGGLLGSPVDNTLKQIDADGKVLATVDRGSYWNALTPQMFRYGILCEAIEDLISSNEMLTDESAAMERMGHTPMMVKGNNDNIKITRESDLILAATILQSQAAERATEQATKNEPR